MFRVSTLSGAASVIQMKEASFLKTHRGVFCMHAHHTSLSFDKASFGFQRHVSFSVCTEAWACMPSAGTFATEVVNRVEVFQGSGTRGIQSSSPGPHSFCLHLSFDTGCHRAFQSTRHTRLIPHSAFFSLTGTDPSDSDMRFHERQKLATVGCRTA